MNNLQQVKDNVNLLYTEEVDIKMDFVEIKTANISASKYGGKVHVLNIKTHPHHFRDDIHKLIKDNEGYWNSSQKGWVLYINMNDKSLTSLVIKKELDKKLKVFSELELINASIINEVQSSNRQLEEITKELDVDGYHYKCNRFEAKYIKEKNKIEMSFKYDEDLIRLVRKSDPRAIFVKESKTWSCNPIIMIMLKEWKRLDEIKVKEHLDKQNKHKEIIDNLEISYTKDNVLKLKIVPNYNSGFFEVISECGLLNNTWLKNFIFKDFEYEVNEVCFKNNIEKNGILRCSAIAKDVLENKKAKFLVPLEHYEGVKVFISKLDEKFKSIGDKIYKKKTPTNTFSVHESLFSNNSGDPMIGFFYVDNKPMMCIASSVNSNKGYYLSTYVEAKNPLLLEEYFGFKLDELTELHVMKGKFTSSNQDSLFIKKISRFIQEDEWRLVNLSTSDIVISKFVNAIENIILSTDIKVAPKSSKKLRI